MKRTVRVGSRDSVLAVIQAQIVMKAVKETDPSVEFELVTIKTTGDSDFNRNADEVSGKGLFIRELEQAIADGSIDIAVHSYKDMPHEETVDLPVVALSTRDSPFDVLVLPQGADVPDRLRPVGSSSLRRTIQFARLYDRFTIKPVRGNVPTRLAKLDNGEYAALILAHAGLNRLSLQDRVSRVFTPDEMIPAASQGILAVQGRRGENYAYLDRFHSRRSEIVSRAERQFLKTLGSGCSSPAAVFAQLHNNELHLTGMYVDSSGRMETGKISGGLDKAEQLGETLAKQLQTRLDKG